MCNDILNLNSKEFFNLLSREKNEIKSHNNSYLSYLSTIKSFCGIKNGYYVCYQEKMNEYLNKKNSKQKMIRLLELSLGEVLFDHTDEENKFLDEKGILTKNDIISILKPSIDKGYIKEPTNYDELVDSIKTLGEKVNYGNDIYRVLNKFDRFFTNTYKELEEKVELNNVVISIIDDMLKSYKSKKVINVDEKVKRLSLFFNNNSSCVEINDDGTKKELNVKFGDLLSDYINEYNNEILLKKRKNIIKSKTDSYYKKLRKLDKTELSSDDFPSYDDVDANEVYNALLAKTLEKGIKNNTILDLHTLTSIMYMRYCMYKDSAKNISISK